MLIAALSSLAFAQETVDLGTLRNEEIRVVQKVLYPKKDRMEVGFQFGATAFDPYMKAPKLQLTAAKHNSESLAYEVQIGAGYGIGTVNGGRAVLEDFHAFDHVRGDGLVVTAVDDTLAVYER